MAVIGLFTIIALFVIVGVLMGHADWKAKRRAEGYGTNKGWPDDRYISPPR